jgi:hypothetical protein
MIAEARKGDDDFTICSQTPRTSSSSPKSAKVSKPSSTPKAAGRRYTVNPRKSKDLSAVIDL